MRRAALAAGINWAATPFARTPLPESESTNTAQSVNAAVTAATNAARASADNGATVSRSARSICWAPPT